MNDSAGRYGPCLADPPPAGPSTQEIAAALAGWFTSLPALSVPWLQAPDPLAGDLRRESCWNVFLLQQVRSLWPLLARWENPAATLAAKDGAYVRSRSWVGRENRAERILEIAESLADTAGGA